jgi:hypothetical protein
VTTDFDWTTGAPIRRQVRHRRGTPAMSPLRWVMLGLCVTLLLLTFVPVVLLLLP